jgi:hypothetical protein
MNSPQLHNGKISIHEPLTIDKSNPNPKEIFERDILKRSDLAERILNRLQEDDCPCALGIYGGWGTGKTSLLNLLKQLNTQLPARLSGNVCFVSIDAWEYESSDGLLIPVVVELNEVTGDDVPAIVWSVVVKRVLFASTVFLAETALKTKLNVEQVESGAKQIKEMVADAAAHDAGINHESILRKWKNEAKEIKETNKAFASLIDSVRKHTGSSKVVICIDNLDRCSPDNVVRLLESVKVFFNVPDCTWLFAMDSEVIANYINHKYEGARMDGNSYLDKIIPEQYHLSLSPTIDRDNIVNLLRFAARRQALDLNERSIPQLPRVLVPRRLIKSAAKLAEFKRQRGSDGLNVSDAMIFNLALLYHVWPDFYQRFSSASDAHVRRILEYFFPVETPSLPQTLLAEKNVLAALPLLKDYAEDQDLFYFIKTVFSGYQNSKEPFVREIINGIRGLRRVGLP